MKKNLSAKGLLPSLFGFIILLLICGIGYAQTITTVAGNGTGGFNGDNIAATSAELNSPLGVALDAAGNIFIADLNNHRIRKVTVSTGIITTVAGNGTQGFSGDAGVATSAELNSPAGIALDAAGNIFVADYLNNRIREVTATPTGIEGNKVEANILVEPNPNEGKFQLAVTGRHLAKEKIEIIIYNVLGEVVYQSVVNGQLSVMQQQTTKNAQQIMDIDLRKERKGIYFIKLISEKGIATKKLIILSE